MDILGDELSGLSEDDGGGYSFRRIADGCK